MIISGQATLYLTRSVAYMAEAFRDLLSRFGTGTSFPAHPCMTRLPATSVIHRMWEVAGMIEPSWLMPAGEHPVRTRRALDATDMDVHVRRCHGWQGAAPREARLLVEI